MTQVTKEDKYFAKCAVVACVFVAFIVLFIKPAYSFLFLFPILLTLPVLTSEVGDEIGASVSGDGAINAGTSSSSGGCDGC